MCGLSGYIGLSLDKQAKLMLVLGLADGIDNRGGHSCGYVSLTDDGADLKYARKRGTWVRSRIRFIEGAAAEVCMMHARFATCGNKEDPMNAHPFAIRRNGRVVLWGAHNGMVPDAFKSAKSNGREINVDSQEIFELLADKDYDGIRNMAGYGVITWIDSDHRDYVNLARLSSQSEICVVSIKGGGIIWASTWKILKDSLKFADLEVDQEFKIDEIGRVYRIRADGVFKTSLDGIKVEGYNKFTKTRITTTTTATETPPVASIDEDVVVDTKTPGESEFKYSYGSYSAVGNDTATKHGSGAYTPTPTQWNSNKEADDKGDFYSGYNVE